MSLHGTRGEADTLVPLADTLPCGGIASRLVVYAGSECFTAQGTEFVPWNELDRVAWG